MSREEFTYSSQEIPSRWTMVRADLSGAIRLDDTRHPYCRHHDRLLSTLAGRRVSLRAASRGHAGNPRCSSATLMDSKKLDPPHSHAPTLRHRRIPAEHEATEPEIAEPEVAEPEVVTAPEAEDPSQKEDGDEGGHRNNEQSAMPVSFPASKIRRDRVDMRGIHATFAVEVNDSVQRPVPAGSSGRLQATLASARSALTVTAASAHLGLLTHRRHIGTLPDLWLAPPGICLPPASAAMSKIWSPVRLAQPRAGALAGPGASRRGMITSSAMTSGAISGAFCRQSCQSTAVASNSSSVRLAVISRRIS
jgi:hypothetical protein